MNAISDGRVGLTAALVLLCAPNGLAAVCSVPSGPYPTVQSAVDDPSCTEIVLAAQIFEESVTVGRDLTLRGASSTTTVIEGRLTAQGGSTELELENLTLDASAPGVAGTWNEAINRDFRYQLTCIGGHAPVYVAEEIEGNRFKIGGGSPGMKVSWQLTGVRQDAWAEVHRIPVEEDKAGDEVGRYLHPEEHGQPRELGISWRRVQHVKFPDPRD